MRMYLILSINRITVISSLLIYSFSLSQCAIYSRHILADEVMLGEFYYVSEDSQKGIWRSEFPSYFLDSLEFIDGTLFFKNPKFVMNNEKFIITANERKFLIIELLSDSSYKYESFKDKEKFMNYVEANLIPDSLVSWIK